MKQYNRFLDPKKDLGAFSAMIVLYLAIMTGVSFLWSFVISSFIVGRYKGDPLEMQQQLTESISKDGMSYIIAVVIGVILFALYRKGALFKGDVRQKGRKMTWKTFLVFIVFLGFAQLVSATIGQILNQMLGTLGFYNPQEDMSEQLSQSWSLLLYATLLGPITEELVFRGAGLRALEKFGKVFAILMTAIIFGLFHANLDQLFFAIIIGLGFGYLTFEYSFWWAIFFHIFNNLVLSQGLHYLGTHVNENLSDFIQVLVFVGGTIAFTVVLIVKRKEILHYIQENRPTPGVFQRSMYSFWFWVVVLGTTLMSLLPYLRGY